MFNLGSAYFHVALTTVRHLLICVRQVVDRVAGVSDHQRVLAMQLVDNINARYRRPSSASRFPMEQERRWITRSHGSARVL